MSRLSRAGRDAVVAGATVAAAVSLVTAVAWWASTLRNNVTAKSSDDSELMLLLEDEELDRALAESKTKLQETALSLHPFCPGSTLHIQPCIRLSELRGYRCRFTLQIVQEVTASGATELRFAVRKDGKPLPLQSGTYKFANAGLRSLMHKMLLILNRNNGEEDPYHLLKQNLTSVSFSSSWDSKKSKLVTLHYNKPIGDISDSDNQRMARTHSLWTKEANRLQAQCGASLISGRAKKVLLRSSVAVSDASISEINNNEQKTDECDIGTHDTLSLQKRDNVWNVRLSETPPNDQRLERQVEAYLFKPEGAFCHPNSNVMLEALTWMLGRLEWISQQTVNSNLELLEMYCGCGAHTMPIAKSGLVSRVTCIEMDDRLVAACQNNITANGLEDVVQVISQDAGKWAKHGVRKNNHYDILLVDPPRQGLDDDVKNLALNRSGGLAIHDIIYISCGRDALVRDLKVLTQTDFMVVDCTLVDLFPGTESVESLVHLRRTTPSR